MADPAFATARNVDELTEVVLPGLPSTDADRIEDALLAELRETQEQWGVVDI